MLRIERLARSRVQQPPRTTALRPAWANAPEGRPKGLGVPYDSRRQGGGPLLWSASFRPRDGAVKFVRADRRAFSPGRSRRAGQATKPSVG
jgi:hypothetical protein